VSGDERGARHVESKKGTNMKIRAAVIVLMLAVVSPLVLTASPASATTTTITTSMDVGVSPNQVAQPGLVTLSTTIQFEPDFTTGFPAPSKDEIVNPGSVSYYSGSTLICLADVALNGKASCSGTTGDLPLGDQVIVGGYSGGSSRDGFTGESPNY
jgi:hypothetical protein